MTTKPQQPELRRSGATASIDLDAVEAETDVRDIPVPDGDTGPVPKANKPGSPSGPVQDKPDLDAFAAKLGKGRSADDDADGAGAGLTGLLAPVREAMQGTGGQVAIRGASTSLRALAVGLRWTAKAVEKLAERLSSGRD